MSKIKDMLTLYFIMGSQDCRYDPTFTLQEAIRGGITCFQFREKGEGALTGKAKEELARSLQKVCRNNNIPFIVNDDLELASLLQADGIHVGQEDTPIDTVVDNFVGNYIGLSVHTKEEAKMASIEQIDYIGVGPIFSTSTKKDAKQPSGIETIQSIRDADISIPMVGIGGIGEKNAESVIRAGANGVSLISAISKSDDPYKATQMIKRML
ncbi:thiamine phosphate synthase [Pontibacillus yanchengensis]|uniref:Thiamine-phosphate synthase n=1 Tax=Pontibacillus yanchengensis Y32 TaxID=1385514 RepID=A0A0A2T5X8_9BACI|nr:thiamine phosphate synthase [Pontibacillus yanchengensis]KGP70854.1 thiamine-phosphate pyrophosphorylase [Pontibacillus yanchengensis Y32]